MRSEGALHDETVLGAIEDATPTFQLEDTIDDLVRELKTGDYEPVDFRPRRKPVPHAVAVEVK